MSPPRDSAETGGNQMSKLNTDETPSLSIVTAVAEATNQSPVEMEPLTGRIDPDALDKVLSTSGHKESSVTIAFEYCGCQVTVTPGDVRIDRQE